ncbi:MAG: hypothetical protein CL678_07625 [Bdellovibrionaceae bacterium]|nr:hypothetical protein [Pseudobdellovibrionaceae bacterium]
MPIFMAIIEFLGKNIPNQFISQDYVNGFGVAVILGAIVSILIAFGIFEGIMLPLWILRCVITLGFMLLYENRYHFLDAYTYFNSGKDFIASDLSFGHGSSVVLWLSSLVKKFPLFNSYHATKVLWSFIGFIGCFLFYQSYTQYTGKKNILLLLFIGTFPSIIFWSSILGKDPIVFFGIGLFMYRAMSNLKIFSLKYFLFMLIGALIASSIRVWLAPIFFIPFAFTHLVNSKQKTTTKVVILGVFSIVALVGFKYTAEHFGIQSSRDIIQTSNKVSKSWNRGGSANDDIPEFRSFKDIILFAPKGMFTAIFRPLPGEVRNAFGLIAGLENLFLLLFVLNSLYKNRQNFRTNKSVQLCVFTVLLWSFLYGLVSYQNLGTAVRFKLQILPLLLMIPFFSEYYSVKKQTENLKTSKN